MKTANAIRPREKKVANVIIEKGDKILLATRELGTGICTPSKNMLGNEEPRGLYFSVKCRVISQTLEDP